MTGGSEGVSDPFAVLGIAPTEDEAAIKAAYRATAKSCHPDVDRSQGAAARFLALTRAFDALRDPKSRAAAYRRAVTPAVDDAAGSFGAVFDFLDTHGRGTERRPLREKKRGADKRIILKVTLEQAFSGGEIPVPGTSGKCPDCGGSGTMATRLRPECPDCGGFGYTRLVKGFTSVQSECRTCRSSGVVDFVSCDGCSGTGQSDRARTSIEIPPGCFDGYEVTAPGLGDPGRQGGPAGNLIVAVTVADHERFRRSGEHLETEITLPVWKLGTGCKAEILGIDGRRMTINVPAGTQPGSRLSLKGQGMPAYPGRGNLVAVVRASLPAASTPQIAAAYAALEAACSPVETATNPKSPASPTS